MNHEIPDVYIRLLSKLSTHPSSVGAGWDWGNDVIGVKGLSVAYGEARRILRKLRSLGTFIRIWNENENDLDTISFAYQCTHENKTSLTPLKTSAWNDPQKTENPEREIR